MIFVYLELICRAFHTNRDIGSAVSFFLACSLLSEPEPNFSNLSLLL